MAPLAVGLTGGIGSGKTRASEIFRKLGTVVLSADTIASDLIDTRREIQKRIKEAFGRSALLPGGTLNRGRIAEIIFSDDRMRKQLDAIVHPFVLKLIGDKIASFKLSAQDPIIMVEAALLFEAGADRMFDYVVVIDAPEQARIARVMARDGSSRAEVVRRIKAQMPAERKAGKADFIISNAGNVRQLERSCRFVHNLLLKVSVAAPAPDEYGGNPF